MSTQRGIQRKVVGVFAAVMGLQALRMLFSFEAPGYINIAGLWMAIAVLVPSIALYRGVEWCRFVIGSVAVVWFFVWSFMPHRLEIDSGFFLAVWFAVEALLPITAFTCFVLSPKQ